VARLEIDGDSTARSRRRPRRRNPGEVMMANDDFEERVAGVASSADPQWRALYRFVVTREGAVSKDEAAAAMGVARSCVRLHAHRPVAKGR
jgi:hypothetical protein